MSWLQILLIIAGTLVGLKLLTWAVRWLLMWLVSSDPPDRKR